MKIVLGKKLVELSGGEFRALAHGFNNTVIDLGTGDGRFVYKLALENTNNLYVGIEPGYKQLEEYSRKAIKNKLRNLLFVVGSLEIFPHELRNKADKVYINFPWGTLLLSVLKPKPENLEKLFSVLKDRGEVEIILGFHPEFEPTESDRLGLDAVSTVYLKEHVVPVFEKYGFVSKELRELEKSDLKKIETTWAKRLTFGKNRPMYLLKFEKNRAGFPAPFQ